MTENDLIKKLNNLKKFQPDSQWKSGQRDILLSQIKNSGAVQVSAWQNFWIISKSAFSSLPQPAYFALLIVFLLSGGLWFGNKLPVNSNGSLYIAKTISEKAHLGLTFGEEEKTQLARQYATENAQEIANTLADPSFNKTDVAAVQKLNISFKNEISKIKDSLPQAEEPIVVSNDGGKDSQGLSVYDPKVEEIKKGTSTAATSTPIEIKDPQKILDEAVKLFDDGDPTGAAEKLNQIKKTN